MQGGLQRHSCVFCSFVEQFPAIGGYGVEDDATAGLQYFFQKFVIDMSVGCQIVLCTDELSIPMVLEKADKIMYEEKKKKGKAR